jgi:hypothetical protein
MRAFFDYLKIGDYKMPIYTGDEMHDGEIRMEKDLEGIQLSRDADEWSNLKSMSRDEICLLESIYGLDKSLTEQDIISLLESYGLQMWTLIIGPERIKICVWGDSFVADEILYAVSGMIPIGVSFEVEYMGKMDLLS